MRIGYIGLGKMGLNMVLRLKEKGHEVIAYNRSESPRIEAEKAGISTVASIDELVNQLPETKVVWLMVSHQGVDAVLGELLPHLKKGDIVIDGGNCNFNDSMRRAGELAGKGILFLDAGVSGGPKGAREGACVMVGGDSGAFDKVHAVFEDISAPGALRHVGGVGAGHFTKMVHNGIEYGMMQAIAEGFAVLKQSPFKLNLEKVADLYNHQSVIESRLVGWLESGFAKHGQDLNSVSGTVAHTGEGAWTVTTAKEWGIEVPIIEGALEYRKQSEKKPSYIGKVLSLLRNQFGGHSFEKNDSTSSS